MVTFKPYVLIKQNKTATYLHHIIVQTILYIYKGDAISYNQSVNVQISNQHDQSICTVRQFMCTYVSVCHHMRDD